MCRTPPLPRVTGLPVMNGESRFERSSVLVEPVGAERLRPLMDRFAAVVAVSIVTVLDPAFAMVVGSKLVLGGCEADQLPLVRHNPFVKAVHESEPPDVMDVVERNAAMKRIGLFFMVECF